MSLKSMLLLPLMAAIYAIPVIAVYHPKIRASSYIWGLGLFCTGTSDILWIWLSKSLDDNTAIAHASLVWDVVYKLLVILIPAIFFGVQLSGLSYAGISLLLMGGLLLKMGAVGLGT